jgi:hypothetical protein
MKTIENPLFNWTGYLMARMWVKDILASGVRVKIHDVITLRHLLKLRS